MITNLEETFYEITGYRLNNTSQIKMFNVLQDSNGEKILNIWRNIALSDKVKETQIKKVWNPFVVSYLLRRY